MKIEVHSSTHVEIADGVNCIHLEYDAAGDFVDAIEAQPERAEEFAKVAIASERHDAIEEAAYQAVSIRQFGGDQRHAVAAVIEDFGFRVTDSMIAESMAIADALWRQSRTGEAMA